jgi:hypothetical protein
MEPPPQSTQMLPTLMALPAALGALTSLRM